MTAINDKYKDSFSHGMTDEYLKLLKEQQPDFYNKYFK